LGNLKKRDLALMENHIKMVYRITKIYKITFYAIFLDAVTGQNITSNDWITDKRILG
jgi:hypothetical protein